MSAIRSLCPFISSNLYTKPPLISNRSATAARSLFKPQIDHTITFAFVSISMPYRFLFRARHNISRFRLTSNLSTYECISVKHNSQKRGPRRSEYRKFKPSRSWMSSRSDLRIKYSHMMGSNNVHHDPNVGTTHTHICLGMYSVEDKRQYYFYIFFSPSGRLVILYSFMKSSAC